MAPSATTSVAERGAGRPVQAAVARHAGGQEAPHQDQPVCTKPQAAPDAACPACRAALCSARLPGSIYMAAAGVPNGHGQGSAVEMRDETIPCYHHMGIVDSHITLWVDPNGIPAML